MKRFIVQDSFWSLFPLTQIGVVVCQGINNRADNGDIYLQMLAAAEQRCLEQLAGAELVQHRYIAVWREALKQFKLEKGSRASVEAMARRILNGHHLNVINPLVDIYNSVSLRSMLPCGGEDLDHIIGDMILTRASGVESFIPLGSEDNLPPSVGEVIYRDEVGAVVRGWLWREADRTKITAGTRNALLYMELLDTERSDDLRTAIGELAGLVTGYLGGHCRTGFLSREQRIFELD